MNKKILEAFAKDIRERIEARTRIGDPPFDIEDELDLVVRIAKQFNPRFDEAKFRKACSL